MDIQAFDDIWVTEARQESGFASEQTSCDFALEVCDSDLFHCDGCLVV